MPHVSWFQNILQSGNYKARVIKRVFHWHEDRSIRPIGQRRDPRNKPNGERTVFSTNGVGKTELPYAKE